MKFLDNEDVVYIVTSGRYSDYEVNSVFLDKKLAESYCENRNKEYAFNDYRIEVYKINKTGKIEEKEYYEVCLDEEGQIDSKAKHTYVDKIPKMSDYCRYHQYKERFIGRSLKSYEEAIKRAKDCWTGMRVREEL